MQITAFENPDTKQFFLSKSHIQDHGLGDKFIPVTYTLPMRVAPSATCPDGVIKDFETLSAVFLSEYEEIENPDPNMQLKFE